jgi:hypothetical protein
MALARLALSLRSSLLASLGLLPLACSGEVEAGGDANVAKPTCTSPQTNETTGEIACQEGYSYRPVSTRCQPGEIDISSRSLPPVTEFVDCSSDQKICDGYRFAQCVPTLGPPGPASCQTGCATDEDCAAGGSCHCGGGTVGYCAADACDSDADCERGYHCASMSQGCGSTIYACQKPSDTCFGNQDCAGTGFPFCLYQGEDQPRRCGGGSVCGRPFLVQSSARVAATAARGDWMLATKGSPSTSHLTQAERFALAQHWTKLGQMEHASIAAFARFSLQLLALGAPPELVEACTQALADETDHTKLCFGIASAYAGRNIGPGPLDVSGSLEVTSLADIVDLVIAEGCFGETSAALEALEAAETASDPVIAAAYSQIARDEQRHAELAFRFVAWALSRAQGAVSERIAAALGSELGQSHPARSVAAPCLLALARPSRAA